MLARACGGRSASEWIGAKGLHRLAGASGSTFKRGTDNTLRLLRPRFGARLCPRFGAPIIWNDLEVLHPARQDLVVIAFRPAGPVPVSVQLTAGIVAQGDDSRALVIIEVIDVPLLAATSGLPQSPIRVTVVAEPQESIVRGGVLAKVQLPRFNVALYSTLAAWDLSATMLTFWLVPTPR